MKRIAAALGRIPTTRDLHLTSLFNRSSGLFDQSLRQRARRKAVNASASVLVARIDSAASGNRIRTTQACAFVSRAACRPSATCADSEEFVMMLEPDATVAAALVVAIRTGEVDGLRRLLADTPGLASARIRGRKDGSRTPLHVATDWPGYFPCGAQIVNVLIDAGAGPNAPTTPGVLSETALRWAASSDDVEVATALIDRGADLEATGASIAGGPPLDCAVGYGCWHVARLLVTRGARVDRLWHAAALGMVPRIKELQDLDPPPTPEDITDAFWQACHGGQRRAAEYLLTAEPTSTQFPTTANMHHSTSPGASTPEETSSSHGYASTARPLPRSTASTRVSL